MSKHNLVIIGAIWAPLIGGTIYGKLMGIIHWAWWLILAPAWVPVAIFIVLLIIAVAILTIGTDDPLEDDWGY